MTAIPNDRPAPVADPLRALLRRALRELAVVAAVIVLAGAAIGYVVDGTAGLLGALLGGVVALVFSGTTVLSMLIAANRPPSVLAGVILGAWLAKMFVLVVFFASIDGLTFYNKQVLASVLLAVVVASAAIDLRAVLQARVPNAGATHDKGPGRPE